MSEEKFEENSTSQDYAAPQDYSAPDMSYSNAGSQAETPVTPVTENGPQTESWQNQGGWQQPQQPEFQNLGSFQNQGNFQSQPDFTGQGSAQNYNTCAGRRFKRMAAAVYQSTGTAAETGAGQGIRDRVHDTRNRISGTFLYLHQCPACNRSDHTCNRAVCEKRQERHGDRGNDHRNLIHRTVYCFLGTDFRQCDR